VGKGPGLEKGKKIFLVKVEKTAAKAQDLTTNSFEG